MSKSHVDYWKSKLRKQKLRKEEWESSGRAKDWEIYVQFRGRREWFNLGSTSRDNAAAKARDLWLSLKVAGWDKTLETFKPRMENLVRSPTIDEFLRQIEEYGTLNPITLNTYARKLRTLVAGIRGLDENADKFDSAGAGSSTWRGKIGATRLSAITPIKVQAWKREMLRAAGDDPTSQKCTRNTINSILRNTKSLFSERLLKNIPLALERPLPIDGVDFEKPGRTRYRSKINPQVLLSLARTELRNQYPESYKIFLLALLAGLRRKEIDGLLWKSVDFNKCRISVEAHLYGTTKTDESEDDVDIPSDIAEELRVLYDSRFKQELDFVVMSRLKAKAVTSYDRYRCKPHFDHLISWLKHHGVSDGKPIHTLRKEFGSGIVEQHGLFAGSHALRHSNINTTREHYVDKKTPVTFKIG